MYSLYKQVETAEEQNLFNQIFQTVFEEMNYDYEDPSDAINLLVKNKFNKYSGTIQFASFKPKSKQTTLEYPELFLASDILSNVDDQYIREVDKVAVIASERKNGTLDNIIETIYLYTKEHDIRYLVGEMNPVFFRALRVMYGLSPLKASKLVRGKEAGYSTQPTILVMPDIWRQYEMKKASVMSERGITV